MMFLTQVITTVLGFVMIMLTLSLIITFLIRGIHYLANFRGATLGEMVGALNLGFRLAHGDTAERGDAAWSAFVLDILTYPALHPAKALRPPSAKAPVPPMKKPGTRKRAGSPVRLSDGVLAFHERREKLARSLDFIAKDDLIDIVCRLSDATFVPGQPVPDKPFPPRWYQSLPPGARSLPVLVKYIEDFFETAEGVSSNQFTRQTKRQTRVLACIIVVLLNLDTIQLARTLYASDVNRENLTQTASQVLQIARSSGAASGRGAAPTDGNTVPDLTQPLTMLTSLLNQPDFELGWQHSWIAQALCVHQHACLPGIVDVPKSTLGCTLRVLVWLVGLVLSCVLLSLGAPFWADRLQDVLSWQSAVGRFKEQSVGSPPQLPQPTVAVTAAAVIEPDAKKIA